MADARVIVLPTALMISFGRTGSATMDWPSEAWRSILARARMTRHHKITREQLSVRSHMSRILRTLGGGQFVEFSNLFTPEQGVPVLVVSFLALLELARESLIEITQQGAFDPIYVKLRSERAALTIA